jgi:hypothetical protein
MAGLYFGATEATVLAKVQNTNVDASVIQIDIPTEMGLSYDRIIGKLPNKMSVPIDQGKISGHILVETSNPGQTTIDEDQSIYATPSNWHLFLNPPKCSHPVSNVTPEMVLDTDYTITAEGVPDFTIKPLSSADRVIANYNTTWEDSDGLGVLRDLLEEDMVIIILNSIGIANNPNLLDNVNIRTTNLTADMKQMQDGDLTPRGIQAINLLDEVQTNDESSFAAISTWKRSS